MLRTRHPARLGRYGLSVALPVVLAMAGCATFERDDRAPSRPRAGLETLPDPVVRDEPLSRWGNDDYVEGGRTYRILPTAAGYDHVGVASWYGLKFHGRRTSSGETYDMYRLSAAHPTLPIPGYARVRNLENGRETVVRVNDRGPFHGARFLDVSYAAAVKLGFAEQGTARVRVTALAEPKKLAGPATPVPHGGRYFLQAGAFLDRRWADARVTALRNVLDEERDAVVRVLQDPADRLYRVRVGPLPTREAATRLLALLADGSPAGSPPLLVKEQEE